MLIGALTAGEIHVETIEKQSEADEHDNLVVKASDRKCVQTLTRAELTGCHFIFSSLK
jgi:hypothetical protein